MSQIKQVEFTLQPYHEGTNKNEQIQLNLKVTEENANYLIHRALVTQEHNLQQFSANTKTRSEVRGGGRKPWKQKGTGRARAGSNRSPLWSGGGVIFGPKPKNIKKKLNRKEFRLSLETLLYNRRKQIKVVDEFSLTTPKTNSFLTELKNWGIENNDNILLVIANQNSNLQLATRNIPNIEIKTITQLNIKSLLKTKQIIFEKEAISVFNKN